jgi:hypothetical protein
MCTILTFVRQRAQCFFSDIDEICPVHPSPIETRSLRVAVIIIFFTATIAFVFFLFVFFRVWLFSKQEIGSYRLIRRLGVRTFWKYSAHAQSYAVRSKEVLEP